MDPLARRSFAKFINFNSSLIDDDNVTFGGLVGPDRSGQNQFVRIGL